MFKWILSSLFLMFSAWIVPGVHLNGFWAAMLALLIMTVINFFIRPVLMLIMLPATVLTVHLFIFGTNVLAFWMASGVSRGYHVDNFMAAFWCALVYSCLTGILMSRK